MQAAAKSLQQHIDNENFLRFLDRQVVAPSQSVRFSGNDDDRGAPCMTLALLSCSVLSSGPRLCTDRLALGT